MSTLISKEKFVVNLEEAGLGGDRLINEAINQVLQSQGSLKADDGILQIEQHIFPVALEIILYLRELGKVEPEIVATALLHDVLEDDRSIDERSFRERFGLRVYNNVKLLTKLNYENLPGETEAEKKEVRDRIYFEKLEDAPEEVILVKLADRLNNVARLSTSSKEGKRERYVKETVEHYLPLAEKHSQYFYVKIQNELNRITKNP